MTPTDNRGEFYCYMGVRQGRARHGRYVGRQAPVLEWIKAEAARLTVPFDAVEMQAETQRECEMLERRREQLGWAVADGLLSREQAKLRAQAIDASLALLRDRESLVDIPQGVDWGAPHEEIGATLRALWAHIELDENLLPVRAAWRAPEWRNP